MRPSTFKQFVEIARAAGVSHLRMGKLEVVFAPKIDLGPMPDLSLPRNDKLRLAQDAAAARAKFEKDTEPQEAAETPQDIELPDSERLAIAQADAAMADPVLFPENQRADGVE